MCKFLGYFKGKEKIILLKNVYLGNLKDWIN